MSRPDVASPVGGPPAVTGRYPPARTVLPRDARVLLLGAGVVATMLPAGLYPLDLRAQLVLGVCGVMLLYLTALQLVLGVPVAAAGIARWRVGPWFLLWGACVFGVATLTWLAPQSGSAARIQLASVVAALAVVKVGVLAWTVGYLLGLPQPVRTLARRGLALALVGTSPAVRGGATPWVLYGLGSAAQLVQVAITGRFGYVGDPSTLVAQAVPYGQVMQIVTTLTSFAVAAAAYRHFSPAIRGSGVTLWLLVAGEIVTGALAGGKQSFVLTLLALLIPYGAVRGRVPVRLLLAGALVFLWVAVPFNAGYREVVRTDADTLSLPAAVAAAPEVLTATTADPGTVSSGLGESAVSMLSRVRLVDSVAIIVQKTPDSVAYRDPRELAVGPVAGLVPRALWPDKPIYTPGYDFSQEYYGLPSTVYTATAVTPVGDLYRHGGWVPVVVGMLALGVVCRLCDTLFRRPDDPRVVCFLLVFLPLLVKFEVDMHSLIMSFAVASLTAVLGARLMCRGVAPERTAR